MPNELYQQMQGQQGNSLEQNFMNFMNQFRGQNPRQIIDSLVSSGKVTQQQLNIAQQRAGQMSNIFEGFKPRFGF